MKRLLTILFAVCVVLNTAATSAHSHDDGTLRILAIGNSFSDDAMEYLPAILDDLGISNVEVSRLYIGGCSLQQHLDLHNNHRAEYIFSRSLPGENCWTQQPGKASLKEALETTQWDIITLQQQSGRSGEYESYEPYLGELIKIIRLAQPEARIAWHMTWSYSTDSKHGDFHRYNHSPEQMIQAIYSAAHQAQQANHEIDIIIPSGTTIQSLRMSAINNHPQDLTRDGYHMGWGVGRYALACTWYEELIAPYTGITMMGNAVSSNKGNVAVTPLTAAYCQKAAKKAVRSNFRPKPINHPTRLIRKIERSQNK